MALMRESGTDYPRNAHALVEEYGDQAIQCCIDSWNQLCPDHPLTNLTQMDHRRRWLFCGHDVTSLKEDGVFGEISKIAFEVNQHLTAKALHKHPDSPVIILNCWTWWNYGKEQVHGWLNHIEVDVVNGNVALFPEIAPPTPHSHSYPLP